MSVKVAESTEVPQSFLAGHLCKTISCSTARKWLESGHTQGSLDGAVTPCLHVSASCRLTPPLRAHVVLCGWPHVGGHSLRKGHTAFKNDVCF